jgi:hypothetical protein
MIFFKILHFIKYLFIILQLKRIKYIFFTKNIFFLEIINGQRPKIYTNGYGRN